MNVHACMRVAVALVKAAYQTYLHFLLNRISRVEHLLESAVIGVTVCEAYQIGSIVIVICTHLSTPCISIYRLWHTSWDKNLTCPDHY